MIFNIIFGIWVFLFLTSIAARSAAKVNPNIDPELCNFMFRFSLVIITIMAIISKLA